MASISLSGINKAYNRSTTVRDVNLHVSDGEFLSLVGPSGCGKSTLLRIIAGLISQDSGSVAIDGREVDALEPMHRDIAMVFQSYALYPHMTVAQNIGFPLLINRLSWPQRLPLAKLVPSVRSVHHEIRSEVDRVSGPLGLSPLLSRRPAQLSGGQQQRVALGRAMIRRPHAFLMDEPLSNLDAKLRTDMRGELVALHRSLGATVLYVTHDQAEAMTMSDRIAVMHGGTILQIGKPQDVYHHPASIDVALFIGSPSINILPGRTIAGSIVAVDQMQLELEAIQLPIDTPVSIGVRPEALKLVSLTEPGLTGQVVLVEHLGSEVLVHTRLPSLNVKTVVRLEGLSAVPRIGETIRVQPARGQFLVFGTDGQRLGPSGSWSHPQRREARTPALENLIGAAN